MDWTGMDRTGQLDWTGLILLFFNVSHFNVSFDNSPKFYNIYLADFNITERIYSAHELHFPRVHKVASRQ